MSKNVFAIDDTKQKFQLTVPDDGFCLPLVESIGNPSAYVDNTNRKITLSHNLSYSKIYWSYNRDDLLSNKGNLYDRSTTTGIIPSIDTTKDSGWYSGTIYYMAEVSDIASSILSVNYDFDVKIGDKFNYTDEEIIIAYIGETYIYCIPVLNTSLSDRFSKDSYNLSIGRYDSYSYSSESSYFTEAVLDDGSSEYSTDLQNLISNKNNSWGVLNKKYCEEILKIFNLGNYLKTSNAYFLGSQQWTADVSSEAYICNYNSETLTWESITQYPFINNVDLTNGDFIICTWISVSNF